MKHLAITLLVILRIHLIAKSSELMNEDNLRGLERSSPRRKPVQFYNPVAVHVGFDGQTHESRPDENADSVPTIQASKNDTLIVRLGSQNSTVTLSQGQFTT